MLGWRPSSWGIAFAVLWILHRARERRRLLGHSSLVYHLSHWSHINRHSWEFPQRKVLDEEQEMFVLWCMASSSSSFLVSPHLSGSCWCVVVVVCCSEYSARHGRHAGRAVAAAWPRRCCWRRLRSPRRRCRLTRKVRNATWEPLSHDARKLHTYMFYGNLCQLRAWAWIHDSLFLVWST